VQDVYPSLKDTPIKLCVEIGGQHKPEKYTDLPIEIVDLTQHEHNTTELSKQVSKLVREPTIDTDRLMPLLRQISRMDSS